ncbi:histone-lysine N-methyltransferase ASHR1 [Pelomyxa schiedti]|nr:histone-lysine N-methyltransferase ASHR1 [Pelomyxa schiedti]
MSAARAAALPQSGVPFDVAEGVVEKGRAAVATRPIGRGDVVLRCAPYAAVVRERRRTTTCQGCWRQQECRRCSACKWAYFCSQKCQEKMWAFHKYECARLAALPVQKRPPDTVILCYRLLCRRKLEMQGVIPAVPSLSWDDVATLKPNVDPNDSSRSERYMAMSVMAYEFLGEDLRVPASELVQILAKLETNAFNISNDDFQPIGVGLYPLAAIINHSCKPNCVTVFEGDTVFVRAIEPITAGTELTVTYIELGATVQQRREELMNNFAFLCKCDQCIEDLNPGSRTVELSGYRCTNPGCNGAIPETSEKSEAACLSCRVAHGPYSSLMEKKEMSLRLLQQACGVNIPDSTKRDFLVAAFDIQRKLLHPHNVQLLSTLNSLVSFCIDIKDFTAASRYCAKTIAIYDYLYPNYWPLRGLQYFMMGKLEWYLEHTEKAFFWLKKANVSMTVSHGSSHAVYNSLAELLHQVEVEFEAQHSATTRPRIQIQKGE